MIQVNLAGVKMVVIVVIYMPVVIQVSHVSPPYQNLVIPDHLDHLESIHQNHLLPGIHLGIPDVSPEVRPSLQSS